MDKTVEILALLKAAQDAGLAADNAATKAQKAAGKAEWAVHNFEPTAVEQVVGQYGDDSDEHASLGYQKKSEYKKGGSDSSKKV